jgi:DNA-binding transcriptional LysR family regulator
MQKRLFEDSYRVFYDPTQRQAPQDLADYLAAEHATVLYEPQRPLDLDQWLQGQGLVRQFRVLVPGIAALHGFIRGSALLATMPSLLQGSIMRDLASAAMPLDCPTMPMYMVWHRRYQSDAAHRWMREQINQIALQVQRP